MTHRTLIIAEAGVNHDGDLDAAMALVDCAADAGADIVKFQTFSADRLASRTAQKATYQKQATDAQESQRDMLRRLELSHDAHRVLVRHAEARGVEFLSTPFDLDSLAFLAADLKLKRLKLGSGEVTNAPLLVAAGATGLPVILSTGMATLGEIEQALAALAVGYLGRSPGRAAFAAALADAAAWEVLRRKVTLLQCTTQYPAPPADANLQAMATLRSAFGLPVGYSDHCLGANVSLAAAALGATAIEKHFTLDRTRPGPDHAASLEPDELAALVAGVREIEQALGDGRKAPRPSETPNIPVARKSLVAARPIARGEPLTRDALTTKRPGDGRSPFELWDLLGSPAAADYDADDVIR